MSNYRKKLIEVALPLEAINRESAREKSIRHGHPSTLHLWWARRPLAACRAVLFAQLVDDPSEYMPDEESANRERERLFAILEDLVKWEKINDETVLDKARLEIARSVARELGVEVPVGKQAIREFLATKAPPVLDPFAGGGSIPLEAQRLGLRAYASDLNPVAVLINKALIEIPPQFADMPPVHPPHPLPPSPTRGEDEPPHPLPPSPTRGEDEPPHPLPPSPTRGEGEEERLELPQDVQRKMVELARQFRKTPTPSEAILWQALRNKQLDGIKFRRQQPIGPFVVDFFAPALRLVVEVDGPIHETQQEADRRRQELLESVGLRVFRLTAEEVENHLPQTLEKLRHFINSLPSPFMGEGSGVRAGSPFMGEEPGMRTDSALDASSLGSQARQSEFWCREWKGAQGLAEDVRYYGQWMRAEAEKRIGHLYPKYTITQELLNERPDLKAQGLKPGDELTVIAWLWARTVKCPNPACGAQMPLARSFVLSSKKGKQAWVVPMVVSPIPNPSPTRGEGSLNSDPSKRERMEVRETPLAQNTVQAGSSNPPRIAFTVKTGSGSPPPPPKSGRGAQFRCLICGQIAPEDTIRTEFKAKRNGAQLMAIVAEGRNGRVYLPPNEEHERIAQSARPGWIPEEEMNTETPNLVSGRGYGITHWHELFTPRQLTALTTFSDLVGEARQKVLEDAQAAFHPPHPHPFPHKGGRETPPDSAELPPSPLMGEGMGVRVNSASMEEQPGVNDLAIAYANAVATYLAFAVDKGANYWSSFCAWHSSRDIIVSTFARQALPMIWDYAEANPLSDSSGNFLLGIEQASLVLENIPATSESTVYQANTMQTAFCQGIIISTDPPYYDNICYADLSDFFYVWLRYSLKSIYPTLFATLSVPKTDELVATPYRFDGDKRKAEEFFEAGLRQTFLRFRDAGNPTYPITIIYAFKQAETDAEIETIDLPYNSRASTGWETMLAGLIESGFHITGTLPMRTELVTSLKKSINALATSIVLVCRPRPADAPTISRRDFLAALKRELPSALRELQKGNIAPVDLAQAAIGPGMAIFSRCKQVLEADGSPMSVRTALALINQALDEYLAESEGEYDADTRWALAWYEEFGFNEGPFGVAETLSKAKNTSVEGLVEAGILQARAGKVRLLLREELGNNGNGWDPTKDKRPTAWEAVQHLIRALDEHGEQGAAQLLARLGSLAESARDLAYRLYTLCERKGWAQDAQAYNMLVVAWPTIKEQVRRGTRQESFL